MIASQHPEVTRGIRESAFLDVLHPGAEYSNRDAMFFLARDGARMTSDAAVLIDDESVAHQSYFSACCPSNCPEVGRFRH
jgi:hypothetical protein